MPPFSDPLRDGSQVNQLGCLEGAPKEKAAETLLESVTWQHRVLPSTRQHLSHSSTGRPLATGQASLSEQAINDFGYPADKHVGKVGVSPYGKAMKILGDLGREQDHVASHAEDRCGIPRRADGLPESGLSSTQTSATMGFREGHEAGDHRTSSTSDLANPEATDPAAAARMGKALLQRKRYAEALELLEIGLSSDPYNLDVLVSLGFALVALKKHSAAFSTFSIALAVDPDCVKALNGCGHAYQELGRVEDAMSFYVKALESDPASQEARQNVALMLTEMGTRFRIQDKSNHDRYLRMYEQAIEYCPEMALPHYNRGVVLAELGMVEEACSCYKKCIELRHGNYPEASCNLAVLLHNAGDLEGAIQSYRQCLKHNPSFEVAQKNLATLLLQYGAEKMSVDRSLAIQLYKQALVCDPTLAEVYYNLGVAFFEEGKLEDALIHYSLAVRFQPQNTQAWNNRGVVCKDLGNFPQAMFCYERALEINPHFGRSLSNKGILHSLMGDSETALKVLQQAVAADPSYGEAHNNLGVVYRELGRTRESIAAYEKCIQLGPANWLAAGAESARNASQNRLLALNYIAKNDKDYSLFEEHMAWGQKMHQEAVLYKSQFEKSKNPSSCRARLACSANASDSGLTPSSSNSATEGFTDICKQRGLEDKKLGLTIAYISADFFTHSVSYFIVTALLNHAYGTFRIICYAKVAAPDSKTERMRNIVESRGGLWRDVQAMPLRELYDCVLNDGVDILVELSGHTAGNSLDLMALKPAPIQISWIGYPGTTGLKSIDYRFCDEQTDPLCSSQCFSEKLYRLPRCFLCYTPLDGLREPGPAPALAHGYVTFGSFNNLAKITPEVVNAWAKILQRVPNSRLLLKSKGFSCQQTSGSVFEAFESRTIPRARIDLVPLHPTTEDHMHSYEEMDISLDTFPYAGTTTTCESLWMGVPCITMRGQLHASNVGVSLLTQVGLLDCIAEDEDAYVRAAVFRSADHLALSQLRQDLRDRMKKSYLCNGPAFTRNVEAAYQTLWVTHGAEY